MRLRGLSVLLLAGTLLAGSLLGMGATPALLQAAPPVPTQLADGPHGDAADPAQPPAPVDPEAKKKEEAEFYELLKLFADTLDQVDRNYVKDVSRRELMEAAIRGMLTKLDQYSNYIPPEQLDRFKTGVESEFGGIGIQITIEDGALKVLSPIVGSPAYRAGMLAGDHITEIEGKTTKGITLDEAVRRMKGPVGTKVKVTVEHPNESKPETISLQREIIRVQTVMGDQRNGDDSWDFMYDHDKKIGYIRITTFSRHTVEELRAALNKLTEQQMRGLVLDLRFDPGGLLSAAIEVSDMFVENGRIVSTEGRNAPSRVWYAHKQGTFTGFPIAVLVNHFSASASEIVSACLKDHHRAVIIGERTWGKGSVQNIIELEGGKSALKLTTAGYMRPNGKNIHRAEGASEKDEWGVKPDDGYEVKLSSAETAQYLRWRRDRDILRKPQQAEEAGPKTEPGKKETPEKEAPSTSESEGTAAPEKVDRQLKKALEYLDQELAKATKKGEPAAAEEKPEGAK